MNGGDRLNARLLPGERVLWTGKPAEGLLLTSRDVFLIPFSALWTGFIVFWMLEVLRRSAPALSAFGVVMLVVGLFFTVGRFAFDAYLRKNTEYMLTDSRVLIARGGALPSFKAVNLDLLPEAEIRERANGRGTVRFAQQQTMFGYGRSGLSIWTPSPDPTPQFLAIPDARRVFDLAQTAAQKASARR